jgi:hypothetical protein
MLFQAFYKGEVTFLRQLREVSGRVDEFIRAQELQQSSWAYFWPFGPLMGWSSWDHFMGYSWIVMDNLMGY